jgi:hypothetical protein
MKRLVLCFLLGFFLMVGFVSAIECSEADYDGDGDVDFMDVFQLRQCINISVSEVTAVDCSFFDYDGSGMVEENDLVKYREWSAKTCPTVCDGDNEIFESLRDLMKYFRDSGVFDANFDLWEDGRITNTDLGAFRSFCTTDETNHKMMFDKILRGVNARACSVTEDDDYLKYLDVNSDGVIDKDDSSLIAEVLNDRRVNPVSYSVPEDCIVEGNVTLVCTDSDGGLNVLEEGRATIEGGGSQGDWCPSENQVEEAYCTENNTYETKLMVCPSDAPFCSEGACSSQKGLCEESDDGVDPSNRGTVFPKYLSGHSGNTDYCQSYSTNEPLDSCSGEDCSLREFFCVEDSFSFSYKNMKCSKGCEGGVCVDVDGGEEGPLNLILKEVDFDPSPENFRGGVILIEPVFDYSGLEEGTNFFMTAKFFDGDEEVEGCGTAVTYENQRFINAVCDVNGLEANKEYLLKLELDSENVLNESNEYDNGIAKSIYLGRIGDRLGEGECYDSDDGKSFYEAGQTYDEGELTASYDFCDGDFLMEYYCKQEQGRENYLFRDETRYSCPEGCNAGACIKTSFECRSGCVSEDKCFPFGFRKGKEYCSGEADWEEQKSGEGVCDNNFECNSNVCVDGECVSAGLMRRMLNWFRRLFG